MFEIQPVVDHIINFYGFEIVPSRIPRDKFQYFKRFIYLLIKNRSNRLFNTLIRLSPIKFLKERPGKELYFRKKLYDGIGGLCEIEIRPVPFRNIRGTSQYTKGIYPISPILYSQGFYIFTIYYPAFDGSFLEFAISNCDIKKIDDEFSKIDELKLELRENKLKKLLK